MQLRFFKVKTLLNNAFKVVLRYFFEGVVIFIHEYLKSKNIIFKTFFFYS